MPRADVTVRMGRAVADGPRVAVELWTALTAGEDEITFAGCLLLVFEDHGLCRRLREYRQIAPRSTGAPGRLGGLSHHPTCPRAPRTAGRSQPSWVSTEASGSEPTTQ